MINEIGLLVKDIPHDDMELFIKKTNSKTRVHQVIDKVTLDYGWVDVLDEALPCLDTIIRNPRRFIVQEEDVVPIEKIKKVGEESIKHLATHTNLIQDVDEEGTVKPIKLLNIFKEETIDLYENRFIYSLINNLYVFVRSQLTYNDEKSSNREERSLEYEGNTKFNNKNISVSLKMLSKNDDSQEEDEELAEEREKKIKNIKEILEDFKASKFMKTMSNATPVRSPIRKTNVILKEQNFIKALELWEFLESYQIQKPVKKVNEDRDLTNDNFEDEFNMTYFLNFCLLTESNSRSGLKAAEPIGTSVPLMVLDYAKKFDVDEDFLRKELEAKLLEATKYKKEQISGVTNAYDTFVESHYNKINKALLLFK